MKSGPGGGTVLRVAIVSFIALILLSSTVVTLGVLHLSSLNSVGGGGIQSGAEGPLNWVMAFQPPNTNSLYSLNDGSMTQYTFNQYVNGRSNQQLNNCHLSWGSGSAILAATVQESCPAQTFLGSAGSTSVSVTLNIPQQTTQAYGGINFLGTQNGANINWFSLPDANGNRAHVFGMVMTDTMVMEFKPNGDPNLLFAESAYWMHLHMNVWGAQSGSLCDPTNQTSCQNGVVFAAPLQAVLLNQQSVACTDYSCGPGKTLNTAPNNDQINPDSQGAGLSLYNQISNSAPVGNPLSEPTDPSTWEAVIQNYIQNGGSLDSPDPNIYQDVYYPIQFTNFGPYSCGGFYGVGANVCYPDVTLTFTIYYLVVGTFIWTNPDTTPYVPNPQPPSGCTALNGCNFGEEVSQWLSNPLNDVILGLILTVIIGAIVVVALLIFAPGLLLFILGRRASSGTKALRLNSLHAVLLL